MATTSTIPAVLDALQTTLTARAGLSGVQVVSAPLPVEQVSLESIQFEGTEEFMEWGSLGNLRRDEQYDLRGFIWAEKPGAGEDAIRAARTRAFAILAEVETMLLEDKSLGGLVRVARLSDVAVDQGVAATGNRVCRLTLTIHVEVSLTRT